MASPSPVASGGRVLKDRSEFETVKICNARSSETSVALHESPSKRQNHTVRPGKTELVQEENYGT